MTAELIDGPFDGLCMRVGRGLEGLYLCDYSGAWHTYLREGRGRFVYCWEGLAVCGGEKGGAA